MVFLLVKNLSIFHWIVKPQLTVKNPGPEDLALPLPLGRGLNKVLWSIGVLE